MSTHTQCPSTTCPVAARLTGNGAAARTQAAVYQHVCGFDGPHAVRSARAPELFARDTLHGHTGSRARLVPAVVHSWRGTYSESADQSHSTHLWRAVLQEFQQQWGLVWRIWFKLFAASMTTSVVR